MKSSLVKAYLCNQVDNEPEEGCFLLELLVFVFSGQCIGLAEAVYRRSCALCIYILLALEEVWLLKLGRFLSYQQLSSLIAVGVCPVAICVGQFVKLLSFSEKKNLELDLKGRNEELKHAELSLKTSEKGLT